MGIDIDWRFATAEEGVEHAHEQELHVFRISPHGREEYVTVDPSRGSVYHLAYDEGCGAWIWSPARKVG